MFRTRPHAVLVAGLCLAVGPAIAHAAILVRIDPDETTVSLNDTFTLDIVADIDDPVIGWGLDLTIDSPAVVSLVGSPAIGPNWFSTPTNDGDGLAGVAFPDSVSGTDIVLATLTFSADSVGETDLLLSITPGDLSEGFALDPDGFDDVTFETGHVTVLIPEPAGLMLLMLTAIPAFRRRL